MAQTGYTPISIYYSSTAGNTPTAGNLVAGELAINTADGKLFYKDSAGVVQVIAGKGGAGVAGGSNTQVQYNSSGSLAGSANFTFNGTTVTIANDASISGLTVGKGAGSGATNTTFGVSALASNSGDNSVTAIGYSALNANTSGLYNVAVGINSSLSNTSGQDNTSVGRRSLRLNTTGSYNTAIGSQALDGNTTASNNTAVGYQAGYSNTTSSDNTAVGFQALYGSNTVGSNTAMGRGSSASMSSGTQNASFGRFSLNGNTTGSQNTAIGDSAMYPNTTGSYNTGVGFQALNSNTTASNNTAVGYQAGYTNQTGTNQTFVGYTAGWGSTGSHNAAFGRGAGYSLSTGYGNCLIGTYAGSSLTTGVMNTCVGPTDSGNTSASGAALTTGSKNTIIGFYNGNQNGLDIRTQSNIIVISDGDGNPAIGFNIYPSIGGTGYAQNTGITTIGLGGTGNTNQGFLALNGSNAVGYGPVIGGVANNSWAYFIGSYSSIVGSTSNHYLTCRNTTGGVYLNGSSATSWTAVSDETRKDIIEPITGGLEKVATLRTVIGKLKTDEDGIRRPYLIAQDVQKVLPEAVTETEDKEGKVLGLSYTEVIPLLVNAIQELKAEVDSLKQQLASK